MLSPDAMLESDGRSTTSAELPVAVLEPNPHNPRKHFEAKPLAELAESIKAHGVLQALRVHLHPTIPGRFVIVAGERRWRAAQLAGKLTVPVDIVAPVTGAPLLEIQLDENAQREPLSPLEEAETYAQLQREYGYTLDMLANRAHRSQNYIRDRLSLLTLAPPVQAMINTGELKLGSALALCGVKEEVAQVHLARQSIIGNMTVSQTEQVVRQYKQEKRRANLRASRQARQKQRLEELAQKGPVVSGDTYNPKLHHREWDLTFSECATCAVKGHFLCANGKVEEVCVVPDCYDDLLARATALRDNTFFQQKRERDEAFLSLWVGEQVTIEHLRYLLWERIYGMTQCNSDLRKRLGLPPYSPSFGARSEEWEIIVTWSEERVVSKIMRLLAYQLGSLPNDVLPKGLKQSLVDHSGMRADLLEI